MASECYCAVLRLAARKVTAVYNEALAPIEINIAQYSLLRRVERAGTVSITEVGELAGLDRSTAGRNCKVLYRRGFLTSVGGEDGREACVALTAAGNNALRNAAPLWKRAQRKIEKALGGNEAGRLRDLLQEL